MRAFLTAVLIATVLLFSVSATAFEGWERLGTRTVEFRGNRDTIDVGPKEGAIRTIMLEVARVIFGYSQDFELRTRLIYSESERSRSIDLPARRASSAAHHFHLS